MTSSQRYVCQNPFCRCELEVRVSDTPANPNCRCGWEMKKVYTSPVLRELDQQPSEFAFVERTKRKA